MVSGHSHQTLHGRPVVPGSRIGWSAVALMTIGVLIAAPQEITGAEPVSTLTDWGIFLIDGAFVVALGAIFVAHDRAWLVLASLVGTVFAINPLLFVAGIVAAVIIAMQTRRPHLDVAPATVAGVPGRSAMQWVGRGAALLVTIAGQVTAALAFFLLMFVSGSGLLDLATLVGMVSVSVMLWWQRSAHPYLVMVAIWAVPAGVIIVIVIADHLGMTGA